MDRDEAKEIARQGWELYAEGKYDDAFPLLEQGADAGFIPAYTLLGDCYWNGRGIETDTTRAIQYYLAAVEMGDATALMRMGDVYLQCNEPHQAIECFDKAYEKGIEDALFNLGSLYYSGLGDVEPDYSKAARYFEKYINTNNDDNIALHLLGRCYAFMEEPDFVRAEDLFAKSASMGNEQAARDRDAIQLGGSIIQLV